MRKDIILDNLGIHQSRKGQYGVEDVNPFITTPSLSLNFTIVAGHTWTPQLLYLVQNGSFL
ncbi:uncharacterized protein Bfra_005019 [Botrytis fragariae]|uniref:Uncharacterized protein n=1 Tax=Botrytis fragariae TaxID=1964551 RepID=A0A8H6EIK6_9HELO|nr:uncharacterized protein Bfra_005019 [Botrytis fragariae]KAF5873556.1 hypothetical protein Bfra_005019 [Botrytis fragariae]